VNRQQIKPGRIFEDVAGVGRRIVTRVQDSIVYFIVIREGRRRYPGSWTHARGGYHCNMKTFVRWAYQEVSMACFRCKYDGTVICDPEEAEIRCLVCGRCAAEKAEVPQ